MKCLFLMTILFSATTLQIQGMNYAEKTVYYKGFGEIYYDGNGTRYVPGGHRLPQKYMNAQQMKELKAQQEQKRTKQYIKELHAHTSQYKNKTNNQHALIAKNRS